MPIKLDVELGSINPANLQQLKLINLSTLPVRYTDKFYQDLLLNYASEYLQFAYWNGFAVAAVCSRVEPHHSIEGRNKLYIMTINVLSAYRRLGIATKLLNHVLDIAKKDESIVEVYLHVQTSNSEAKNFYIAAGFEQTGVITNYYKRIEPADCFVFQKSIRVDHQIVPMVVESMASDSNSLGNSCNVDTE